MIKNLKRSRRLSGAWIKIYSNNDTIIYLFLICSPCFDAYLALLVYTFGVHVDANAVLCWCAVIHACTWVHRQNRKKEKKNNRSKPNMCSVEGAGRVQVRVLWVLWQTHLSELTLLTALAALSVLLFCNSFPSTLSVLAVWPGTSKLKQNDMMTDSGCRRLVWGWEVAFLPR